MSVKQKTNQVVHVPVWMDSETYGCDWGVVRGVADVGVTVEMGFVPPRGTVFTLRFGPEDDPAAQFCIRARSEWHRYDKHEARIVMFRFVEAVVDVRDAMFAELAIRELMH